MTALHTIARNTIDTATADDILAWALDDDRSRAVVRAIVASRVGMPGMRAAVKTEAQRDGSALRLAMLRSRVIRTVAACVLVERMH